WGRKALRDSVALQSITRSLAIESRLRPPDSLAVSGSEYLAARLLFESGRPEPALPHFERALAWRLPVTGETDSLVAWIEFSRGQALRRLRRLDPSVRSLERSREIRIRLYGEIHPAVASSWAEEDGALLDLDRFEEARTAL